MRTVMLLVLVVALAACGGASTRRVSSGGLSLEIPRSWSIVTAQSLLARSEMRQVERDNPVLGGLLQRVDRPSSPVTLVAFDPHRRGAFSAALNIFLLAAPPTERLQDYVRRVLAAISRAPGFHGLLRSHLRVGGERAVELTYTLPYRFKNQTAELHAIQVLFLHGHLEHAVTFAADGRAMSDYGESFAATIRSIRLTN